MNPTLHAQILTIKKYQAWRTGEDTRTMGEAGIVPAAITSALDAVIAIAENHLLEEMKKAEPSGYAYRYRHYDGGTVIRFNDGREVNGSRPIEALPYWFTPHPAEPNRRKLLEGLAEADGCFRAAYIEGLAEVLSETTDARLKDLVERRILYAHHAIVEAISQPAEPVAVCVTCGGSGMVDDGEIDCYENGEPYENGPVKCVKDCPDCVQKPQQIPGPKPVGEAMSSNHRSYAEGWNACRASMLEAAPSLDSPESKENQ